MVIICYTNTLYLLYANSITSYVYNVNYISILSNNTNIFYFFIFIFLSFIKIDYTNTYEFFYKLYNTNLLNSLSLYHPVILYSYIIGVKFYTLNNYIVSFFFKKNYYLMNNTMIIVSIFLGSY